MSDANIYGVVTEGKTEALAQKLSQNHITHHISHKDSGIEPESPRRDANNYRLTSNN
jgi:hypothetical protein